MVREKSPLAKPRHSALAGAFVVANLAGPVPSGQPPNPRDEPGTWCLRQCSGFGNFGLAVLKATQIKTTFEQSYGDGLSLLAASVP
jgi:hypothetical protein